MYDLDTLGASLAASLPDYVRIDHGEGVLDAGYTQRKRPGLYGEVRVLLEQDDDSTPTVLVAVLWYDTDGEPVEDELVAEGLCPADLDGIRAALEAAR